MNEKVRLSPPVPVSAAVAFFASLKEDLRSMNENVRLSPAVSAAPLSRISSRSLPSEDDMREPIDAISDLSCVALVGGAFCSTAQHGARGANNA